MFSCRLDWADFNVEVYLNSVPVGAAIVRWTLPSFLDQLIGAKRNRQWLAKRCDVFRGMIDRFGLDSFQHFTKSNRARIASTLPAADVEESPPDGEFPSVSTAGLILILSYIPQTKLRALDTQRPLTETSLELLQVLCDRLVPADCKMKVCGEVSGEFHHCELSARRISFPQNTSRLMKTASHVFGSSIPVHEFLARCGAISSQRQRYPSLYSVAESWLKRIALKIGDSVELARNHSDIERMH